MTVIVGVLCNDGVVIGSDSSATFGDSSHQTVEQQTRKIEIVGDIIVAGTGSVGLQQRFIGIVDKHKRLFADKAPQVAANEICKLARDDFLSTGAAQNAQVGNRTFPWFEYGALVAWAHHGTPVLVEFSVGAFQPEFKKLDNIFYGSLGSGDAIADAFLGFMKRTYYADGPSGLATGRLMVTWAVEHTIDVNTGGIKGPTCVAVLSRQANGEWKATRVAKTEVEDHVSMVEGIEKRIARIATDLLAGEGAAELPEL